MPGHTQVLDVVASLMRLALMDARNKNFNYIIKSNKCRQWKSQQKHVKRFVNEIKFTKMGGRKHRQKREKKAYLV